MDHRPVPVLKARSSDLAGALLLSELPREAGLGEGRHNAVDLVKNRDIQLILSGARAAAVGIAALKKTGTA